MEPCLRHAVACGLVALLAACGGSDDTTPPTQDHDVRAAWRNVLAGRHTWTARGTGSDGRTYTVTIDAGPAPDSAFPVTGVTAAHSLAQLTTEAGGTVATGTQETWYDGATLQVIGMRHALTGATPACDVAVASSTPPTAAKVNTSGPLADLDERSGCGASFPRVGTLQLAWSLEFEPGIVWFCVNTTERDLAGLVASFEGDCVQVDPGGVLGAAVRITVRHGNGFSLVAR
jgi:hypothetical protein